MNKKVNNKVKLFMETHPDEIEAAYRKASDLGYKSPGVMVYFPCWLDDDHPLLMQYEILAIDLNKHRRELRRLGKHQKAWAREIEIAMGVAAELPGGYRIVIVTSDGGGEDMCLVPPPSERAKFDPQHLRN
jgi:hypothetical protein